MTLKTPLHDWHVEHGGRMVDFGGWSMPVLYSSIVEEANATRTSAGLFDISHMGRVCFTGPQKVAALDHLLTNRVDNLAPSRARYSLLLDESAGVLDDILVYHLAESHLVIVNAGNREKAITWFEQRLSAFDAEISDRTCDWGMLAVQGPKAIEIAEQLFDDSLASLRYFQAVETRFANSYAMVSRTGYTGEDGVEIVVEASRVVELWDRLVEIGSPLGLRPAGLGSRDALRIEAGMPLYGHELTEEIDPVQAGLGWAVKSQAKDFVGKRALAERDPARPVRVGLQLEGRRIARQGQAVHQAGSPVGVVTSGTLSPTLERSIAMAFVKPECSALDTDLEVIIRDRPSPARVVALPFHRRSD